MSNDLDEMKGVQYSIFACLVISSVRCRSMLSLSDEGGMDMNMICCSCRGVARLAAEKKILYR
eukprot:scaffold1057_cov203-Skeletonema_marinoi.AAC.4